MTNTTHHPLTVGRATTIHALNELMDDWGRRVGKLSENGTYAEALCGQRSPSYNRNHASSRVEVAVVVTCKNCNERMDNIAARKAAKEAGIAAEVPAALASTDSPKARKEARLASLQTRLAAATARREARGETVPNITETTLAGKIEGVERWLRTH